MPLRFNTFKTPERSYATLASESSLEKMTMAFRTGSPLTESVVTTRETVWVFEASMKPRTPMIANTHASANKIMRRMRKMRLVAFFERSIDLPTSSSTALAAPMLRTTCCSCCLGCFCGRAPLRLAIILHPPLPTRRRRPLLPPYGASRPPPRPHLHQQRPSRPRDLHQQ